MSTRNLREDAYGTFEKIAGRAARFELIVRLLADKTTGLSEYSDTERFHDVLTPFYHHFKSRISANERITLFKAKEVRNELVHSNFKAAFAKVKPQVSGVSVVRYDKDGDAATIRESFAQLAAAVVGKKQRVPDTPNASKFGWFMEAFTKEGVFELSLELFNDAIEIVDRISYEIVTESID